MPAGRPPQPVPQELANIILENVGRGVPLAEVVRSDPRFPTLRAIYDWLEKDKEFAAHFARARVAGYDMIAADLLRIADDASNDYMEKQTQSGTVTVFDAEHVQRSKLRIETRLKLLAKWDPKRYGERVEIAGDPDAPLSIADRSENDIARRIALALALGLKAQREKVIEGEATTVEDDDPDDLL